MSIGGWLGLLSSILKLVSALTSWMERKQFIAMGEAQQIKANLEASDAVLQNARKAYADSLAGNPIGGVPRDIQDENSRD